MLPQRSLNEKTVLHGRARILSVFLFFSEILLPLSDTKQTINQT